MVYGGWIPVSSAWLIRAHKWIIGAATFAVILLILIVLSMKWPAPAATGAVEPTAAPAPVHPAPPVPPAIVVSRNIAPPPPAESPAPPTTTTTLAATAQSVTMICTHDVWLSSCIWPTGTPCNGASVISDARDQLAHVLIQCPDGTKWSSEHKVDDYEYGRVAITLRPDKLNF
jgi:hypothetical protein